jgi:hypothetical protein
VLQVKSKKVESIRPVGRGWRITNGVVEMNVGSTLFRFNEPGQNWSGAGIVLQRFPNEGKACFVQLITPNRTMKRVLKPGAPSNTPVDFVKALNNGLQGLDAGFPYTYGAMLLVAQLLVVELGIYQLLVKE